MLQLLSEMYGLTINEFLQGERIAPEKQLAAANETIAQVMKESPFLFKERQAYWQRQWTVDHRFDMVLLIVLALAVQVLAIVLVKPACATAGAFLTIAAVMIMNNRKADYVEHHLYDENLPQDCAVLIKQYGMCFPKVACCIQAEHPKSPWTLRVFLFLYRSYCFLYPHFGHTPFSFSTMPQRGQRSKVPSGLYS